MSNTRTYEELKQKLDAMADEMHGRKSEPNTAAKKDRSLQQRLLGYHAHRYAQQ